MIKIEITATDAIDLRKQLAELLGSTADTAPLANGPVAVLNDPPKATRKSKADEPTKTESPPAADTTTTSATQVQTEAGAASAEVEASDGPLTYDSDIKPAILDVSANHGGREAVLKLLGEFNVDHASKLTPEQYPGLLAAVAALKGGA